MSIDMKTRMQRLLARRGETREEFERKMGPQIRAALAGAALVDSLIEDHRPGELSEKFSDRIKGFFKRGEKPERAQAPDPQRRPAPVRKPPKFSVGAEQDIKLAAKQPFTAMDYALDHGHHPELWNAVQGSPYEKSYRMQFGNQL